MLCPIVLARRVHLHPIRTRIRLVACLNTLLDVGNGEQYNLPVFFVSDLLEVVDRRAKIVATELSDEQSSPQPSGSFLLGLVSAWFAA